MSLRHVLTEFIVRVTLHRFVICLRHVQYHVLAGGYN